jgi:hypothetical protein
MDARIIIETKSQMAELVEHLKSSDNQKDKDEQRRTHWRMIFATTGSIEMGGMDKSDPVYVTTRDLNQDGVGFFCKQQFAVGQNVLIIKDTDLGPVEVAGAICHCTGTVGMYKIGVRFDFVEPDRN